MLQVRICPSRATSRAFRQWQLPSSRPAPAPRSLTFTRPSSSSRAPLFHLTQALVPGLLARDGKFSSPLDLKINDSGQKEAWAITGPAAEVGGAVKARIVAALLGLTRLEQRDPSTGEINRPALSHPFLLGTGKSPSAAMQLVSFSSRLSSVGSGGGGGSNAFVDFTTRYGAIREEDRVTLRESVLRGMGTHTGLVARMSLYHDPLLHPEEEQRQDAKDGVTRLPWSSPQDEERTRARAKEHVVRLGELAPLLKLTHGDPPLLERPLIALSNGQTRRARILTALCQGSDVLVLEEPFTGLDPPTRASLSELLASLHAQRKPRIVCVLREQDAIPDFITHVLAIGDEGEVLFNGERTTGAKTAVELAAEAGKASEGSSAAPRTGNGEETKGGYEVLKRQSARGVGRGDESAEPVVAMHDVSVAYKGKKVLDSISLTLPPGSKTILVGDNGSGKTTLLSLLLGSHPQSFALPSSSLTLLGSARASPSNATPLLLRRVGQLSPELANAFPRRGVERGGLTVREAVGTGFEGIFARRPADSRTVGEKRRVRELVRGFAPVIASRGSGSGVVGASASSSSDDVESLLETPFTSLTPGSQGVVLFLRSIVHRPSLLVLDEPFQGMSSRQVRLVRDFLDERGAFAREKMDEEEKEWRDRMAMVVVSHFEDEWPGTAGRLVRLEEGRMVEVI